jgi:hypothetical protein
MEKTRQPGVGSLSPIEQGAAEDKVAKISTSTTVEECFACGMPQILWWFATSLDYLLGKKVSVIFYKLILWISFWQYKIIYLLMTCYYSMLQPSA